MTRRAFLVIVAASVLLCDPATARAAQKDKLVGKLLVLAAASTTDAVDVIRAEFARLHPEVTVRTSFAASSALARQIEAGARADVFLSASSEWADHLEKKKLVARRRDLLGNRLVVIVPVDAKIKIDMASDLVQKSVRRLAMADPQSVPAGIYARQALEKLQLWEKLRSKVAGAADVRQALKFVETGAADAGIVYATDAAADKRVRIALKLDPKLSEPIRYPLVLVQGAESNAAAVAFDEFLASPAAAAVFERFGFVALSKAGETKPREAIPCGG
ncbi:MAG: molybdate ABC transporter substrate-binding protein [Pirellulales bacterium]